MDTGYRLVADGLITINAWILDIVMVADGLITINGYWVQVGCRWAHYHKCIDTGYRYGCRWAHYHKWILDIGCLPMGSLP